MAPGMNIAFLPERRFIFAIPSHTSTLPVGISWGIEVSRRVYLTNAEDTIREMSLVIRRGGSSTSPSPSQKAAFAKVC